MTAVDTAVYVIPTDAPEADGTLAWNKTTMVLVTVRAGGEQGLGWSYTSAAAQTLIREMLADVVDIALWDLKARLLGQSLTGLLGRALEQVPVYGSGGFTTYDEAQTRQQLSGWVDKEQIPRVKIKIGESWGQDVRRDLARTELAREVIGPDTELYVDANGGYSAGLAVRVAAELDAFGVTWFEEPVSSQDLAGLATVREQVRPDVAAREYSWSLADSARLIDAGAVDCLQLDVTRCVGITEFLRGAALAASHNLQVSGHCAPNLHAHVGRRYRTCATSSTSTITSGSRACSSTERSILPAAR